MKGNALVSDLERFILERQKEKAWLHLNGYENGDPATNGEYSVLSCFAKSCDQFIDVGANHGIFIDRALQCNPDLNVVAYEANPTLSGTLKNRFEHSSYSVEVNQCALSDTEGELVLHLHPTDDTASSLTPRKNMMPSFTDKMIEVTVPCRRLNTCELGDRPTFVKIDVEGAEYSVISSGAELMNSLSRVAVLFEYSFGWDEHGSSLKDCFHWFDARGFTMYRLTPLGLERVGFYTHRMDNMRYCNYLAVKGESPLDDMQRHQLDTPEGTTSFYAF